MSKNPEDHLECRFCREVLAATTRNLIEWNSPLFESENFIVIPTLGHFVPGWLLIIPREHYICVGALSGRLRAELQDLKDETKRLLQSLYGSVITFEHGPCTRGTSGVCIDHAHLHLVPTNENLTDQITSRFPERVVSGLDELSAAFQRRKAYLFLETPDGTALMWEPSLLPSQFMRMLLAQRLGMLDRFDWRTYSGEKELRTFLSDLATLGPWRNADAFTPGK